MVNRCNKRAVEKGLWHRRMNDLDWCDLNMHFVHFFYPGGGNGRSENQWRMARQGHQRSIKWLEEHGWWPRYPGTSHCPKHSLEAWTVTSKMWWNGFFEAMCWKQKSTDSCIQLRDIIHEIDVVSWCHVWISFGHMTLAWRQVDCALGQWRHHQTPVPMIMAGFAVGQVGATSMNHWRCTCETTWFIGDDYNLLMLITHNTFYSNQSLPTSAMRRARCQGFQHWVRFVHPRPHSSPQTFGP